MRSIPRCWIFFLCVCASAATQVSESLPAKTEGPETALFHGGPAEMQGSHLALGALALLGTVCAAFLINSRLKMAYPGLSGWLSKVASTFSPELCPGCGSPNHPSASRCPGCGAELQPTVESEVVRARCQ